MQIKKMEVQGFKSFADKTVIEFPHGVTAIVGPNGSGKSNISDSVRWVLGEQSTKNLRGTKMEDVIFAGTESRKKVGFAEVSLYIDNQDGTLPVDYSEVVVTRRLFRSGDSSYLINGAECRLKDVQELFLDTGVGKDGYSLIGQGKIDEIVSSKSDERRAIFEEASGIMKYKTRKEEAIRKLSQAESNLQRVMDILNEVESNLTPLEEKSKKARQYLDIKEKLKVLDVNIFLNDVKQNATKLAEIDGSINTLLEDLKKEENDTLEMEKAKINLKERLEDVSAKIEENQAKYYELENSLEKMTSKKNLAKAGIENNNVQIERLDLEVVEDNEKINAIKEEIESKEAKKENLLKNKERFVLELDEKQTKLAEVMQTLDSEGEKIENIKKEIEELQEENETLNVNNSSYEATIEAYNKQLLDIEKSNQSYTSDKDKLSFEKDDIVSKVNSFNRELSKINDLEKELDKNINDLNTKKQEFTDFVEKSKSEYMTASSSLAYLKHLKDENEGYQKSVKSAVEYAKENNMKTVYGTVAEIISTEDKYERAIEIALGGFLQNIIVESENDAKRIIEYLKENTLGRATFLPLNTIRKVDSEDFSKLKKYDGYIDSAINVVNVDSKYISVINLALNKCIIVDNLDNANNIYSKIKEKIRIVTLDGEIIQPTGSITGGKISSKSLGLLGRDEKIKKLEEKLKILEKDKLNKEEELKNIESSLKELDNKKQEVIKEKENINLSLAVYNEKLDNLNKEEEKIIIRKEKSEDNKANIKSEIEKLNLNITENTKVLDENIDKIEEKKSIVEEYVRYNKDNQKILDVLNEDITNLKISLASFDESSMSIDEMKEKLTEDIKNFEEGIERKNNQKREYMIQILNFQKEIEEVENQSLDSQKFKEEYNAISEKLKLDKQDISEKLDVLEVKMLEGVNRNVKIKDEISKLENKKIKFDLEIDNIKNKMWDDYELTINSCKEYVSSMQVVEDFGKAKKEAENYRNQIKALGDIDVTSIEAYNETKARYDFITAQKKDLDETKKKLENLISNITTIMKDQFSSQFKIINSNFKYTFEKLFGGGKAALKLTDESNILESGIEIEVQPPGKKLQSMSLLSGGEKALTAIALLFAILKIKAPPFCILDEIEAALDDVNVARFADYIKMYSDNTQFIVITHRKGTMEAASTVYGVTMEEYGISKLVSMKLK